jgi:predicted TIM-barrel fold metal-dependent hydrolase
VTHQRDAPDIGTLTNGVGMTALDSSTSARSAVEPGSRPLPIISIDSHIGPRVVEDLRPYCPKGHLDLFDEFCKATAEARGKEPPGGAFGRGRTAFIAQHELNMQTAGHHDIDARLADMDRDGVAAEVIFHGSMNGEPLPFADGLFFNGTFLGDGMPDAERRRLIAIGIHMYNAWLAELVSSQPARHVGCIQVPSWDIKATIREIEWGHSVGLRSVNWPSPRSGIVEFDDPAWENVWRICEELELPLTTHCGALVPGLFTRDVAQVPHAQSLVQMESGGWPSRRGLHRMLFSGVFERYPNLKLVLTEQAGGWWPYAMREMDSSYVDSYTALKDHLPRKPSEYCATNVFVGASFISADEAREAVDQGFSDNVMWGSDYPHPEGTWAADDADRTRKHLRWAFADIAPDRTAAILSTNAARVYGFDLGELGHIAERIEAPSLTEIAEPLEELPTSYSKAFRTVGPWA